MRTLGTRAVTIDGRLDLLPEPLRVNNGQVYLPLEFVARRLDFNVKDENGSIRLIRTGR